MSAGELMTTCYPAGTPPPGPSEIFCPPSVQAYRSTSGYGPISFGSDSNVQHQTAVAGACSAISRCLEREHDHLSFLLFGHTVRSLCGTPLLTRRKRRSPQRREPELYDNPARIDPRSDRYIQELCHQGDHARHHKRHGGEKTLRQSGRSIIRRHQSGYSRSSVSLSSYKNA